MRNISWWEGMVTWASFSHRYEEMGGGEIPGLSWHVDRAPSYATTGEVDVIDGFIIVISPWAVRELRFDESLGLLHGYDLDICFQARAAGKKVVTTDFRAIHHHPLDLIGDQEAWVAAHMRIAEKWEGTFSDESGIDWKQRARRTEAELEAMRVQLRLAEHYITRLSEDLPPDAAQQELALGRSVPRPGADRAEDPPSRATPPTGASAKESCPPGPSCPLRRVPQSAPDPLAREWRSPPPRIRASRSATANALEFSMLRSSSCWRFIRVRFTT